MLSRLFATGHAIYTRTARVWITDARVVATQGDSKTVHDFTWALRLLYLLLPLRPETLDRVVPLLMVPGGPAVIRYQWHHRPHIATMSALPKPPKQPPPPLRAVLVEGANMTDISQLVAPLAHVQDDRDYRAVLSVLLGRPIQGVVVEKILTPTLVVETRTRRL